MRPMPLRSFLRRALQAPLALLCAALPALPTLAWAAPAASPAAAPPAAAKPVPGEPSGRGGKAGAQAGSRAPAAGTAGAPPPSSQGASLRPLDPATLSPGQKAAIVRHPVLERLSTVGEPVVFAGAAKGSDRFVGTAFGGQRPVPLSMRLPGGVLYAYATPDGKRLWLAGAMLRETQTVLRLGDLLPLLEPLGIHSRETALAVSSVAINGGGAPPSYSLTFKTGSLAPHRTALAAAEQSGRIRYSLATGRVIVLRRLVLADGKGNLSARPVVSDVEDLSRLAWRLVPEGCKPLEAALRSPTPERALSSAKALLYRPSIAQTCAARYFAIVRPKGAAAILRKALKKARLGWPGAVVEALAALEPAASPANVEALARMIARRGVPGAVAVCDFAPIAWTDALLARTDLDPGVRKVLSRCAYE